MKLETASYDSAGVTHNALAEETAFLSYSIEHKFNEPALATIILADPTGAIAQKYDVDTNAVYIGPGRAKIQDPTGTCIFEGRILKARHEMGAGRVILLCEDWLSQLNEHRINYDMREDIDGSGLRQSQIMSDTDSGADTTRAPAYTDGGNAVGGAISRDGAVTADDTIDANDAGVNDMTLLPTPVQANGDGYYFGYATKFGKITVNVGTAGNYVGSIKWLYYNGSSFTALPNVTDNTNSWKIAGTNTISFNAPADWVKITLEAMNLYWVFAAKINHGGSAVSPVGTQAWIHVSYMWDDAMSGTWGNDDWNGYYLVLPIENVGSQSISTGPQTISVSRAIDTPPLGTDGKHCWIDDNNFLIAEDDDILFYIYSKHKPRATEGSLYQAASLSAMRVRITYSQVDGFTDSYIYVRDVGEAVLYEIGRLENETTEKIRKTTFEVPLALASSILETDGSVDIAFRIEVANGNMCTFKCRYLKFEMDIIADGYGKAIEIIDTVGNPARLTIGKDLDVDGLGIWDYASYSIVREIYHRINEIVLASDPLFTLDTSIESTSGITTRHYEERTPLEIIKDLAEMDKTVFWIALADHTTPTVIWKGAFTDGAPTEMTDASVDSWSSGEYDYIPMRNEYHVYGVRIGDNQLYIDTGALSPDPGVDSKTKYGVTRSDVIKSTGTTSEYETTELGKALVERDEDVHLYLRAIIAGLSSLRLGSEVNINSTFLGLTNQKYVITHWTYDSNTSRTSIRLHPRQSTGFIKHKMHGEHIRHIIDEGKLTQADKSMPPLSTQTWS